MGLVKTVTPIGNIPLKSLEVCYDTVLNGMLKSRCFPAFPVQACRAKKTLLAWERGAFRLTLSLTFLDWESWRVGTQLNAPWAGPLRAFPSMSPSSANCPLRKPCETCESLRNEKPICESLRKFHLRKLAKPCICETLRILRNKCKSAKLVFAKPCETRICETCETRFAKLGENTAKR